MGSKSLAEDKVNGAFLYMSAGLRTAGAAPSCPFYPTGNDTHKAISTAAFQQEWTVKHSPWLPLG